MLGKKILPFLIGFVFLLLLAGPSLAEESMGGYEITTKSKTSIINRATATANSTGEGGEEVWELTRQIIEEKQAIRQEIRERIGEKTQARLRNLRGIFLRRLNNLVSRLNLIIERIESRLDKIKQGDEAIDTTEIESVLENAKQDLSLAEAQITALEVQLDDLVQLEDDPFQGVKEIKDSFKEIKDLLLSIRKDLVKTIGLMKGLRLGN